MHGEIYNAKRGLDNIVWGFIDGALCRTFCPSYHQKQMYSSGNKQDHHGLKFQSGVTPDGIFACMFGVIKRKFTLFQFVDRKQVGA
jgi:hypothetical protein